MGRDWAEIGPAGGLQAACPDKPLHRCTPALARAGCPDASSPARPPNGLLIHVRPPALAASYSRIYPERVSRDTVERRSHTAAVHTPPFIHTPPLTHRHSPLFQVHVCSLRLRQRLFRALLPLRPGRRVLTHPEGAALMAAQHRRSRALRWPRRPTALCRRRAILGCVRGS